MKKYVVISLTVGGLGNKIFNHGDIVNETNFPKGNVEALVRNGFLREVEESETDKNTVSDPTPAPEYGSVTKAELMDKLTADGIEFDVRANKETLYELAYPKPELTEEQIIAENKSAAEANMSAASQEKF